MGKEMEKLYEMMEKGEVTIMVSGVKNNIILQATRNKELIERAGSIVQSDGYFNIGVKQWWNKEIMKYKHEGKWVEINNQGAVEGRGKDSKIPKAETQMKISGDSAKTLKAFVEKNQQEIDNDHDITTFFIDTEEEYKRFGVQIPGICLVVRDKRASKASLKREAIVQKFNKSKTLKRYSDWKKGNIQGVGDAWYSIYISAKDARENGIKAISEDIEDMEYTGYLDESGDVILSVKANDIVEYEGDYYVVVEVDGENITILNENDQHIVCEDEIAKTEMEMDSLEESEDLGEGLIRLGTYQGKIVIANDSDNVFLVGV